MMVWGYPAELHVVSWEHPRVSDRKGQITIPGALSLLPSPVNVDVIAVITWRYWQ
jgi:hypothetical protein